MADLKINGRGHVVAARDIEAGELIEITSEIWAQMEIVALAEEMGWTIERAAEELRRRRTPLAWMSEKPRTW